MNKDIELYGAIDKLFNYKYDIKNNSASLTKQMQENIWEKASNLIFYSARTGKNYINSAMPELIAETIKALFSINKETEKFKNEIKIKIGYRCEHVGELIDYCAHLIDYVDKNYSCFADKNLCNIIIFCANYSAYRVIDFEKCVCMALEYLEVGSE